MLTTLSIAIAIKLAGLFAIAAYADRRAVRLEEARKPQNEIVFLMGNPAAGKSTVATREFGTTHTFIDCDQFKAAHPDYDPKNPAALHAWSAEQAGAMFKDACHNGRGRWVLDGTGANVERMRQDIAAARQNGFTVSLFYVRCSLETSLRRNSLRDRVVPEEIVRQKAAAVAGSFEQIQRYADNVIVVENDVDVAR